MDIGQRIAQLTSLRDAGLLSQAEFDAKVLQAVSTGGTSPPSAAGRETNPPASSGPLGSGSSLRSIGSYDLYERIGEGGMGAVYRGRHRASGMVQRQGGDVAVKIVHAHLLSKGDISERFRREAEALMVLDHPNIVKVHDVVEESGRTAIVMEWVPGRALSAVIGKETGPIPWDRAQAMVVPLLSAVAHAHSRGIVHRDLKPENIVVMPSGEIKLLDFGIARLGESRGRTKTGTGMGTVDYMAPEQFLDAKSVDARADVYALGLTLYEMLAGRLPWDAADSEFEVMSRKKEGRIPPPTEFYPSIPPWVVSGVMAAIRPNPLERTQSVEALEASLRGEGVRARAKEKTVARAAQAVEAPVAPAPNPPPAAIPGGAKPATSKLPLLVGGAVVLIAGGWFALRGPSVASIELAPAGDVFLVVGSDATAPMARALDEQGNVVSGVQVVCTSDTPVVRLRDGKLSASEAAKAMVTCAAGGAEARFSVNAASNYTSFTTGYELRPVPGGTFSMGSPASEANRSEDETQHDVTLSHAYRMGTTEVTQAQWETVMGSNPSEKETSSDNGPVSLLSPSYPVQNVSWCDAVVFANTLSEKDGLKPVYGLPGGMSAGLEISACNALAPKVTVNPGADGYRLPTEAEWERAARGGTTDTWSGTNREADVCGVANVADASAKLSFTHWHWATACYDHQAGLAAVGSYNANAYGLKDMSGNVLEWTWDIYGDYPAGRTVDPTGATDSTIHVHRGGCWRFPPVVARAAHRVGDSPGKRYNFLGFRLSRTIP